MHAFSAQPHKQQAGAAALKRGCSAHCCYTQKNPLPTTTVALAADRTPARALLSNSILCSTTRSKTLRSIPAAVEMQRARELPRTAARSFGISVAHSTPVISAIPRRCAVA